MNHASTIAVIEDDEDIRMNVCNFLLRSGFACWGAASAEDFYVRLLRSPVDLAVVDIGLPGASGLDLVSRLSTQGIPCVLMTARADLESRIEGLDAGALQYFVKPVDLNELVAGIRSQLRHLQTRSTPAPTAAIPWSLDLAGARLLSPELTPVELTTRERELLQCLVHKGGALVSKQELVDALGGGDVEDGFHRVEAVLNRLRKKTLEATGSALPVRAVFGKGLVFVR